MSRRLRRVLIPLAGVLIVLSGCTSVTGAAESGSTPGPTGGPVAPTGAQTSADPGVPSSSDAASSSGAPSSPAASSEPQQSSSAVPTTPTTPTVIPPVAEVKSSPAVGSKSISPSDPITVSVDKGTLTTLTLKNAETGYEVKATFSTDRTTWKTDEVLGYGKSYTLTGEATGTDGKAVKINSTYTVVTPKTEVRTTISPTDGVEVGVAMPVVVKFAVEPDDRALIEKNIKITTTPEVDGRWGWIQHDGGTWGLDYRPEGYWPEGTKVHVEANVYGLKFADGSYGKTDLTSDFTIGRNQVVKADVGSHQMIVQQDGRTVATYPASYGQGNGNPDLTTRSGIHVINDMNESVRMSNPKYGYVNLLERWAVRISNNGEFIHANPNSTSAQGNTNVTHGCINLSLANAEAYYRTAMLGDPVEITGTDINLGPSDGDIFDYAISWETWKTLSALD